MSDEPWEFTRTESYSGKAHGAGVRAFSASSLYFDKLDKARKMEALIASSQNVSFMS
jgi:hypothetical protein